MRRSKCCWGAASSPRTARSSSCTGRRTCGSWWPPDRRSCLNNHSYLQNIGIVRAICNQRTECVVASVGGCRGQTGAEAAALAAVLGNVGLVMEAAEVSCPLCPALTLWQEVAARAAQLLHLSSHGASVVSGGSVGPASLELATKFREIVPIDS